MAIKLVNQQSNLTLASKMMKGDKGDPGEPGIQGEPGIPGKPGVYVGKEEPTDDSVLVWFYQDCEPIESGDEVSY